MAMLGQGASATVWRGVDLETGLPVAVRLARTEKLAADFHREVAVLADLRHPGIEVILDSGYDDKQAYLVMPFVNEESLQHRLTRTGLLPFPTSSD